MPLRVGRGPGHWPPPLDAGIDRSQVKRLGGLRHRRTEVPIELDDVLGQQRRPDPLGVLSGAASKGARGGPCGCAAIAGSTSTPSLHAWVWRRAARQAVLSPATGVGAVTGRMAAAAGSFRWSVAAKAAVGSLLRNG